ncbi:MAG: hypothetical protein CMD07_05990 [Flavobacteriales bacterium]|nr:hypothetical protein [Flavobacteriales bacterium]
MFFTFFKNKKIKKFKFISRYEKKEFSHYRKNKISNNIINKKFNRSSNFRLIFFILVLFVLSIIIIKF